MSPRNALIVISVTSVLALNACSKSQPPVVTKSGIEIGKFAEAFQESPPEVHGVVDRVRQDVRYHQYLPAIGKLDELTSDARVTEPQKHAITNLIEQLKQRMDEPAAAPDAPK